MTGILNGLVGLYENIPAEQYYQRTLDVTSHSALKELRDGRTPAHYKHAIENPTEQTAAMRRGSELHLKLFEPNVFSATHGLMPDFGDMRSSKNRGLRDAWLDNKPGFVGLKQSDLDRLADMEAALRAHPEASSLLFDPQAKYETTLVWIDIATGVMCKARVDIWLPERRIVVDLKTTQDASDPAFSRSISKFGYHTQGAFYTDAFEALGKPIEHYALVVIEAEAPHCVAVYVMDDKAMEIGRNLNRARLERLAACIATNEWPAFPGIRNIGLPAWDLKKADQEVTTDE